MKYFWLSLVIYFGVFLLQISLMSYNVWIQSNDTVVATFIPISIISEQDFDLNEFQEIFRKQFATSQGEDHIFERLHQGDYLSTFPFVTGILALPVYFIFYLFRSDYSSWIYYAAHLSASIITAFSVLMMQMVLLKLTTKSSAKILSIFYAFGTLTLSLISQSLWQHTSVVFFLSLLLFALSNFQGKKQFAILGISSSLLILSRPTLALIILIFGLIYFKKLWQDKLVFILSFTFPMLFQLSYNFVYKLPLLSISYSYESVFKLFTSNIFEGSLGLLISPSKGLLVYSPLFFLLPYSVYIILKNKPDIFYIFCLISTSSYILLMGKWYHWYGGTAFGYRMICDILPLLVILLIPAIQIVNRKLIYLLLTTSIIINFTGAILFNGTWHRIYDKGPADQSWLWSLKDSEFSFYFSKFYDKIL